MLKPDRVPVPQTELFRDAWHMPTLAALLAGLGLLVAYFAFGWYALALKSVETLVIGFLCLNGVALLLEVIVSRPVAHLAAWRSPAAEPSEAPTSQSWGNTRVRQGIP